LFEGAQVAPAPRRKTARDNPFIDTIQCGDCVAILRQLPKHSVDAVVTSPPYFQ